MVSAVSMASEVFMVPEMPAVSMVSKVPTVSMVSKVSVVPEVHGACSVHGV